MDDGVLPPDQARDVAGTDPDADDDTDTGQDVASSPAEDEDWSVLPFQHMLMRRLHDAITSHVEAGDFVPSLELETALEAIRAELAWN